MLSKYLLHKCVKKKLILGDFFYYTKFYWGKYLRYFPVWDIVVIF